MPIAEPKVPFILKLYAWRLNVADKNPCISSWVTTIKRMIGLLQGSNAWILNDDIS